MLMCIRSTMDIFLSICGGVLSNGFLRCLLVLVRLFVALYSIWAGCCILAYFKVLEGRGIQSCFCSLPSQTSWADLLFVFVVSRCWVTTDMTRRRRVGRAGCAMFYLVAVLNGSPRMISVVNYIRGNSIVSLAPSLFSLRVGWAEQEPRNFQNI